MKESDILKACLDLLSVKGIFHMRINNIPAYDPNRGCYRTFHGTKGVPDIIAILPEMTTEGSSGVFCGIEVKMPRKKLSAHQEAVHDEIIQSGGYALTVHSVDELEEDLKELGF